VRTLKVVTEGGGNTPPDRSKTLEDNGGHFFPGYVHAEVGEFGTVVETDYPQEIVDQDTGEVTSCDTIPTVAFDRTGTATIVCEDEIELVEPLTLLGCDRCGAFEGGQCRYHVEAAGPGHRCLEWYGHADCGKGLS
jgi:hypothetical protein